MKRRKSFPRIESSAFSSSSLKFFRSRLRAPPWKFSSWSFYTPYESNPPTSHSRASSFPPFSLFKPNSVSWFSLLSVSLLLSPQTTPFSLIVSAPPKLSSLSFHFQFRLQPYLNLAKTQALLAVLAFYLFTFPKRRPGHAFWFSPKRRRFESPANWALRLKSDILG